MQRLACQTKVQLQRLFQNLCDGLARIEAVIRVLENQLDLAQMIRATLLNFGGQCLTAGNRYLTTRWWQQSCNRLENGRFSRTTFSDKAQRFTFGNCDFDPVNGWYSRTVPTEDLI